MMPPMMPPEGMPPMMPPPMEEMGGIPSEPLPEMGLPTSTGNGDQGHKKALLKKLMSNLLDKPGRSLNEIINGVKAAIGAYKNYAKEWDALNGISPESGGGEVASPSAGGGPTDIQKILQDIQAQKGAQAPQEAPKAPQMPPQAPQEGMGGPGYQNQDSLIAGQPQTSTFNRSAPVSQLGVWGF